MVSVADSWGKLWEILLKAFCTFVTNRFPDKENSSWPRVYQLCKLYLNDGGVNVAEVSAHLDTFAQIRKRETHNCFDSLRKRKSLRAQNTGIPQPNMSFLSF